MRLKTEHKIYTALLLIFGIFLHSATMFRSGLEYNFGIGFWGPNGHDGVWHLALANQVLKGFPPPHPVFSGHLLSNYHDFYDIIIALISKLFSISSGFLYFQIFPILLSASLGVLSFAVGLKITKKYWGGFWFAFLNYFAGSFGYLVSLRRAGEIGGESIFWSMQSISTMINPPFALSLVMVLGGLLAILTISKWNWLKILGVSLLFGLIIGVKAYGGIIALVGLGIFGLLNILKGKKVYGIIFVLSVLISLIVFLPVNRGAGGLFVFEPFWFIHSMIESPDRLYIPNWALMRYSLFASGRVGPKMIFIETASFILFIVGNFGMRALGMLGLLGRLRKKLLDPVDGFLLAGLFVGIIIPMFFVQKGTAWNSIQFLYYALVFANFYFADFLAGLCKKSPVILARLPARQACPESDSGVIRRGGGFPGMTLQNHNHFRMIIIFILVILTIPTTISTVKGYFGWPPPAAIPNNEINALNFLRMEKEGVVLAFPFQSWEKRLYKTTPLPLRVYESTAYVSWLSNKQTFLEDEMNLQISGFDFTQRKKSVETFFSTADSNFAKRFLAENKIKYIYMTNDQKIAFPIDKIGLKGIYDSNRVRIYEVTQ